MEIAGKSGQSTARPRGAPLVALRDVSKAYDTAAGTFAALQGIDLEISAGDFLAVVGKSGSGKSTLINMVTGIDRPTSGDVRVAGVRLNDLGESALASWRGRNVGIVFQFFQLLPTLTVAENVALPMDFCATFPASERRPRALGLLDRVGIADQADKLPATLSGGQQQRAAIARALANEPPLLIADEPTGNLDSATAAAVLDLFAALTDAGTTVMIITHEREIVRMVDRVVRLADGRVEADDRTASRARSGLGARA